MFKKNNRVSSWLFKPLLKGKTIFSPSFRVKYLHNKDVFRLSVVIPKKIIKKRIERNILKRKILHYIKSVIGTDDTSHYVFWVTKGINDTGLNNWKKEIDDILKKTDIKKQ